MEKSNTKMFLEVDATQLQLKKLVKQDFLELSMKAISSANPNKNNSWFTRESMERSIGSFVDKPILGYFENGDFVSHNGDWQHDSETGEDYWDTLGQKGERILGLIRQSDEVKIVEDENGLSWVTFTCALWTQYCFKQVKRLIKDAIKAQQNGGSTKNISVEVDITDYEILDNGVMKINAFNLIGVTILGTRNGVKVEPGIENAELSVIDIMGHDLYSAQEKSVRLAYEKELDGSTEQKEDSQVMTNEENLHQESLENSEPNLEASNDCLENHENLEEDNKSEVCPDCGKNPCECSKNEHEEGGCDCGDNNNDKDEDDKEDNREDNAKEDGKEEDKDPKKEDESKACEESQQGQSESDESLKCEEQSKQNEIDLLSKNLATTTTLLEETRKNLEQLNNDYESLKKDYENVLSEKENLSKSLEEVSKKVADYEHKDFLKDAYELIDSANLGEEDCKKFKDLCEKFEITSIEDLKVKVAVAVFDINMKNNKEQEETKVKDVFAAPVSQPNVEVITNIEEKSNKKTDSWSRMKDYLKNNL